MEILIAFFLILMIPLMGLGILISESMARNHRQSTDPQNLQTWLGVFGSAVMGFGLLGVMVLCAAAINIALNHADEFGLIFGVGVGLIVTVLIGTTGFLVFRLSSRLNADDVVGEATRDRNLARLRILGWIFVFLPMTLLVPAFLIISLLTVILVAAIVMILANAKRARQGQLLWAMAISVRYDMPLADEIEAQALTFWGKNRVRTLALAERLREGLSLPDALDECPGLVPDFALTAIRSGEKSGKLDSALREVATYHIRQMTPANEMFSFTWLGVYYCAVFGAIFTIVAFQMIWIIPKFKAIFEGFGMELPLLTEGLIDASDSMAENMLLWCPVLGLPILFLVVLLIGIYRGWGNIRSSALTRWFPRSDTPWILRALSFNVEAGQPLFEGITELAVHHPRSHIRHSLSAAEIAARGGNDPWDVFREQGLLRKTEVPAISAAERLGNLPWVLRQMADSVERRQRYKVARWLELVRPFIIVAIGLAVAYVCIALFMPLIKLVNDLA